MSRLPTELLYNIIEGLIPSSPPVAFSASHVVTRTLVNLCLVSRSIHHAAIRCLFAHCLYIDSPERLKLLQQTLINHHQGRAFGENISLPPPLPKSWRDCNLGARLRSSPISLIKSLFLAPYPGDTIDCPEIAPLILGLCTTLGPQLTRLVIDIPLRSLYPEDDINHVRPFLRAAFSQLVALEEFVSARDELFLDVTTREQGPRREPAVWSRWPNLKRLALYNADLSSDRFIRDIGQCANITHLVLTRSDGLEEPIPSLNPVPGSSLPLQRSRELRRVSIVNTASGHWYSPGFSFLEWNYCFVGKVWNGVPGGCRVQIVQITVPVPVGREDDDIELCQEWVREAAIQGTVWEWNDGKHLLVKPDSNEPVGFKFGWVPPGWPPSTNLPPELEHRPRQSDFDSD
jgi:hypothetical protein